MATSNRYSQHARRAMAHARSLAKESAHEYVDSTHLFIGILREDGGVGCNILHDLQVDLRRTERAFRQLVKPPAVSPNPTLTPALREALLLAADESRWLGHHYIGTEHLLLALARSNEPPLLDLLRILEINPEQIRRRARRLLQEGISEVSLEQAKRVARLSELSRRVLNGAEQLAAQMGHKHVGLAHLLLMLARERRSICADILRQAGLDMDALEANLTKPHPATGGMFEDVIDRAVDRAESFGSHYTGTDHLLFALAQDRRGARLLRKYGADPQMIVQLLRAYFSQ